MLSPIARKEAHIIGNINKNELDGRAVKSFEGTCTTFQSLKLDQQITPLTNNYIAASVASVLVLVLLGHVSSFIQFLSYQYVSCEHLLQLA